jgi:serine/threonine-protein kinase
VKDDADSNHTESTSSSSRGAAADGPSVESVKSQLARILASRGFAHAERLSRFLRFVVDQTVEGRGDELKEYLLGLEVFGRGESFDPRIDTVVRVEAHRLRAKLKEYYENEGRDDALLIDLPKGSYVPAFHKREPARPLSQPAKLGIWSRSNWKIGTVAAAVLLAALVTYWLIFYGQRGTVPETPVQPHERPPSIAVLPFADLSPQRDLEYFCDGITDELINTLAQVEGLHVVSRTSAFAFKGKPQDIRQIGQQLNVGAVLDGSVRKMGERMRITAQLVNVADGFHLWSRTYQGNMQDIFDVQDKISRAIVDALSVQLVGGEQVRLGKRHTQNLDAYNLYLRGRYQWNKRTGQGLNKGIEYFQQAITLDTSYAPAHAGLADSYAMLASYGVSPPKEVMPKAKAAAVKALQIDDTLAEAHASLGLVKSFFDWDWPEAEREYKRAIELNPGYATAHQWYSGCLRAVGRLEEALTEIRRAQELDPLSLAISRDVGRAYRLRRQPDLAIEQYRTTLELEPSFPSGYLHLALEYQAESRYEAAIAALERGRSLPGANPLITGGLGYCYASWGKRSEALPLLDELKESSSTRYVSPMATALIYIGLGEKERAFEWLEKAYEEHDRWLAWLKVDPVFDSLRSDARFSSLLKRVGLLEPR